LGEKMVAKVAIFTIGAWPGQIENMEEKLVAMKAFAGKYSSESRLLEHAKKKKITHLLVSHELALNNSTLKALNRLNVKIMDFKDISKLL